MSATNEERRLQENLDEARRMQHKYAKRIVAMGDERKAFQARLDAAEAVVEAARESANCRCRIDRYCESRRERLREALAAFDGLARSGTPDA